MSDAAALAATIDRLRAGIDEVDDAIVALLARRAALVGELWEAKLAAGVGVRDPEREAAVFARLRAAAATAGLDPEAEPSPRRIADLTALVRRTGATTVFTETLASPKLADTIAREAGVRTEVLDPVEGVRPHSHDDYFSIMRRDLATLRPALGCP